MINAAHVMLYSRDAEADRAFLRDTLGFPGVDAGEGWVILKLPPAEVGVHPTDGEPGAELYLMCDDLDATLADLAARGVALPGTPQDRGWGIVASMTLPSGAPMALYQPRHPVAHDL